MRVFDDDPVDASSRDFREVSGEDERQLFWTPSRSRLNVSFAAAKRPPRRGRWRRNRPRPSDKKSFR